MQHQQPRVDIVTKQRTATRLSPSANTAGTSNTVAHVLRHRHYLIACRSDRLEGARWGAAGEWGHEEDEESQWVNPRVRNHSGMSHPSC